MGDLSSLSRTLEFIKGKFAEYYERASSKLKPPSSLERRELGFSLFEGGIIRHKRFTSLDGLTSTLKALAPSDVYYSCAYYERPDATMEEKGWLGADLTFDIDADRIRTACEKAHDSWVCTSCGAAGRGVAPGACPTCNGSKFEETTWLCDVCLEPAKAEVLKLLEFLVDDLGLSEDDIDVYFSGHRGYHVHVESDVVRGLDAEARREVVDYVMGIGLDIRLHGFEIRGTRRPRVVSCPKLDDVGWRGRLAKGVYEFLSIATRESLEGIGLRDKVIDIILAQRDQLLKGWGLLKGVDVNGWRRIAKKGAELRSANVDPVVTTDVHRLIRLAGTLHGKTALRKVKAPLSGIEGFDPLKEAVAFERGEVTIFVYEAPEFRLGERTYGPFKEKMVELPTAAALILLCKGVAIVR